eukprot:TRINITY_DN35232_c0_g1_i1.p2 TRINITY_DN35232_c0_g1~~TRINITY_DN35232_c0_g1_i1.p2  ORF type:complete len:329 (+),score=128.06 TRINITY_DN35232_c0_g1_i1:79-987(+)
MVVIHMKSTSDRDEWLFSATTGMEVEALIGELVFVHNGRVRVRAMASALYNLLHEEGYNHLDGKTEEQKNCLNLLHERARHVLHIDRIAEKAFFARDALAELVDEVQQAAIATFAECQGDDAIDKLWKAREDSETKDDDRLRAWYFLQLIDPAFKERDFYLADKAKLWWAGKEVQRGNLLKKYTGGNEKSKMVCKITAEKQGCPSREPKLQYNVQRDLRQHFEEKRDTFKQLEESELAAHKNVRRDPSDFVAFRPPTSTGTNLFGDGARGSVDATAKAGGTGLVKLNTDVRKIHHPTLSKEP